MRWFAFACLLVTPFLYTGNKTPMDHASVSVYAVNTKTGKVINDENSHKSLIPASCMKIVTTAAALHLLGPESRFQTQLEYDGKIEAGGTLQGNLYIQGGGDPSLGSERASSSLPWDKQIDAWAHAMQQLGIQSIRGEVIGDDSLWEKARANPGWAWEDLGNYYGAGASALSFHENAYDLFLKPGDSAGEPATIMGTDLPL